MKKIFVYIYFLTVILMISSCTKIDNYSAPGETLTGNIIDASTGKPIFTEQPDGTRIKLLQQDWNENPLPQYFWVKPDGTFRNTKIFKGTYLVTPMDGPFFPLTEPQKLEIKGSVNLDFKVVPFLRVSLVDLTQNGNQVIIKYKIERPQGNFKINDAKVFVSTTNQATNASFDFHFTQTNDLQNIDDATILATTYLATVNLTGGRTFYIRIGARSNDNVSKRYNYTDVTKVIIP